MEAQCLSIIVVVSVCDILHKLGLIQKKKNKTTCFHNPTEVCYSWVKFGFDSRRSSAIWGRDFHGTKFAITAFEVCAFGGQSGESFLSNHIGQYIFLVTSVVSVHHARW